MIMYAGKTKIKSASKALMTREREAFTLVELLIVVAIIALLAAILFPVFAKVRENARRSSCQSNLKQLALAMHQYTSDSDGRMPAPCWFVPGVGAGNGSWMVGTDPNQGTKKSVFAEVGGQVTTGWVDGIYPYVKNDSIFECPSDATHGKGKNLSTGYMGLISYGMNGVLNGYVTTGTNSANTGPSQNDWQGWKSNGTKSVPGQLESAIVSPANKILFADVIKEASSGTSGSVLMTPVVSTAVSRLGNFPPAIDLGAGCNYSTAMFAQSTAEHYGRHFGGVNIAFVDGHVKWMPPATPGLLYYDVGTPCGSSTGCGTLERVKLWAPTTDTPYFP